MSELFTGFFSVEDGDKLCGMGWGWDKDNFTGSGGDEVVNPFTC